MIQTAMVIGLLIVFGAVSKTLKSMILSRVFYMLAVTILGAFTTFAILETILGS